MSDKTNDGGPAFPAPNFAVPRDMADEMVVKLRDMQGMTLRDYFAAAMDVEYQFEQMTGDCAEALGVPMPIGQGSAAWPRWRAAMRAKLRYMAADAMLKARSAS